MSKPKRSAAAPYSPLQRWVDRIALDIASKGLKPGEPYLTTDEAGALLGCSRATAHRAMKRLVEQSLLVSRPGSGTFVGPGAAGGSVKVPQSIHVAMPLGFRPCTTMPLIRLLQSVARALGGLGVHFNTFPAGYDFHYVAETVLKPYRAGEIAAVLAAGCHWSLHQYFRDQGVNALVIGSMFPDRQFLPSIDKDSRQGADILVNYLVQKNHRRFVLLAMASGLAGVDLFTDAVSRSLSGHGIPADSLTLRYCNGDEPVTIDRLRELLGAPTRPTAILTDEEDLANLARRAAESLGLKVPCEVEIVFEGALLRTGQPAAYPHTRTVPEEAELVEKIVGMIRAMNAARPLDTRPLFIPVQMAGA